MKKLFVPILKRIQEINFRPASEWVIIKSGPAEVSRPMKQFILPVTITIAIATFLGYILELDYVSHSRMFIVIIATIKVLSAFCTSFFTFYITALLVQELCPKMDISIDNNKLFKLLAYSFSAFWTMLFLAGLLANYKSLGSFFIFLGLYGIIPFWAGCDIMLELPRDKKNKLLAVCLFIAIVVYLLIGWSFGFALRAAHLAGMMN